MTNRITAVCAIIEHDNKILLAQRPANKQHALLWEFPGGKLEPDETPEAALHREIHEELLCRITNLRRLPDTTTGTITLIPFLVQLAPDSPPPTALEHAALRWLTKSELKNFPLPHLAPADHQLIQQLPSQ